MKTVNDVMSKVKGEGNANKIVTGKGAFSKSYFSNLTNALINDTTFKVKTIDKNGKEVAYNLSELIRADMKKTFANAKYPQPSEAGVLDSSEICTDHLPEAIQQIVFQMVASGKKFSLPAQTNMIGDIYLANVTGKTKTVQVRDIKTKEPMGSTTITTKDSIQLRAKSPVPKHLQNKVRKDINGKII